MFSDIEIEKEITSSLLEEVKLLYQEAAQFTNYNKLSAFDRCILYIDSRIRYSAAHPRISAIEYTEPLCRICKDNIGSNYNALLEQILCHYINLGFKIIKFPYQDYFDITWDN